MSSYAQILFGILTFINHNQTRILTHILLLVWWIDAFVYKRVQKDNLRKPRLKWLSNDWEHFGLTKNVPKIPQKRIQLRQRLRTNLSRLIIYLAVEWFNNLPIHKINNLEKSHKLIIYYIPLQMYEHLIVCNIYE